MQKKKFDLKKFLIAFILIFSSLFSSFSLISPLVANAVTVTGYSPVLSDLKIDDNFNPDNYPSNKDDYSLKILQIAESTGGELFIYTYQPSAKFKQFELTTISISQYVENNAQFHLYDLKLLDSDGVFAKYKVKGINLKSDVQRYYEISEIHRKFDLDFGDKQPENGNTITEIPFDISERWSATTLNGTTYYNVVTFETIKIVDKYVGFVRYKNNNAPAWINKDSVDSHFVAFSSDHDMDKLLKAVVSYSSQKVVTNSDLFVKDQFETPVSNEKELEYTKSVPIQSNDQTIWGKNKYEFKEIQTVQEFFDSVDDSILFDHGVFNSKTLSNMSDNLKKNIKNMQYVLRFATTDYVHFESSGYAPIIKDTFTIIQDVTILQLTFEKDGDTFTLGVIDNKANGSGVPDALVGYTDEFSKMLETILEILGILVLITIIALVLQSFGLLIPFLKLIGICFLKVGKGIWWVISSPFTFLKSLIKKE